MDTTTEDYHRNRPRSVAEEFGENLGDPFADVGPSYHPDERSSAARHAKVVKARTRAAAQQRDVEVVLRAADAQKDQRALDEVAELEAGAEIPPGLLIRAARAARRSGTTISTAVQLAANVRR
jgi:hypothetical protein